MPAHLLEFRKAVAIDPNDPETQYDLGMELKASGNNPGAIAAYQRAIALKPDLEKAHYALGIALRSQGQTDASNKELQRTQRSARISNASRPSENCSSSKAWTR